MTATATIQRVRELAASRLADAEQHYLDLAESLAAGGNPDPETVLQVLVDADRSHEDLQADVDRIEARAAVLLEAAKLSDIAAQIAAAEQQEAALRAEFAAFSASFKQRIDSVVAMLTGLRSQSARAEEAKATIARGTFDSPAQKAIAADLAQAIGRLSPERMALEDELRRARNQAAAYEAAVQQAIKQGQPRADVAEAQEMLAGAKRKVADLEHRLQPITAELEQIGRRQAALNAERLA